MHRIGPFSRLSGLSIKALRFYHEIGLLVPAVVEPGSRYRAYAAWQVGRARQIRLLRELGLSLAEITSLVSNGPARAAVERDVLSEAELRLQSLIDEKSRELAAIRARLAWLKAGHESRIRVRSERAMVVASIRDCLDAQVDGEELEQELLASVRGTDTTALRGTLWHACGHGTDRLDAEVFVEVDPGTVRASGRVKLAELPAITAACAPATDDDGAQATFIALHRWVEREGQRITGPKRELRYATTLEPSLSDVLLDVQFPIS